jgi:signal recognition particle GTPase
LVQPSAAGHAQEPGVVRRAVERGYGGVPGRGDEEFWERVEEILITSDVGVPTTAKLVAELEQDALERNITSGKELRELMIEHATRLLDKPIELDISQKPTVVLMVGVNGTGKTTNIGKLVHFLPGKVMLAAAIPSGRRPSSSCRAGARGPGRRS